MTLAVARFHAPTLAGLKELAFEQMEHQWRRMRQHGAGLDRHVGSPSAAVRLPELRRRPRKARMTNRVRPSAAASP
jgi:hypothetical protein